MQLGARRWCYTPSAHVMQLAAAACREHLLRVPSPCADTAAPLHICAWWVLRLSQVR